MKICSCYAHSRGECACGAWDENEKEFRNLMKPKTVWVLYVNVTSYYVSFKIEQGLDLGAVGKVGKNSTIHKDMRMIDHELFDTVNYVPPEDVHESEADAYKALIKILQKKVRKP